jgi:hypothetical protein
LERKNSPPDALSDQINLPERNRSI